MKKIKTTFQQSYNDAWSLFVNTIGKRELQKLDYFHGGFQYRIPPAGALIENGKVTINCQFPGLLICYTTDGSEPTAKSKIYREPIAEKALIKCTVFDSKGRGSRTIEIDNR
jgi:hexosaminidase